MQPARGTLKKILADTLRKNGSGDGVLLAWSAICGYVVGQNTRAAEYEEGVLTVEVPDVTWQRQLQDLGPQYIGALKGISPQPVSQIRFIARHQPANCSERR